MAIEPGTVERIEIEKRDGDDAPRRRLFGPVEVTNFVAAWNAAQPVGLCKFAVEYRIEVHLKGGGAVGFRTNGPNIKAENDYCFAVAEASAFEHLWAASGTR